MSRAIKALSAIENTIGLLKFLEGDIHENCSTQIKKNLASQLIKLGYVPSSFGRICVLPKDYKGNYLREGHIECFGEKASPHILVYYNLNEIKNYDEAIASYRRSLRPSGVALLETYEPKR